MADADQVDRYACKHCRRQLFTSDDIMPHTPESHQITARRLLKDAKNKSQAKKGVLYVDGCASIFLADQLPWMDEDMLAEGKIKCPNEKCQSRLGSFDWAGSQCSCGTWVTPSIKMTKSRVDMILKDRAIPIVSTIMTVPTYAAHETTEQTATTTMAAVEQRSPADTMAVSVSVDELDLED